VNASFERALCSWYQGSLIDPVHAQACGWANGGNADSVFVVITHDCDLQSASEAEDTVEILRARWQTTTSGEHTFGKNPRIIHLTAADEFGRTLVIEQAGKIVALKSLLLKASPLSILSEAHRRRLATWLASRYNRAPFPDSFNNRLKKARTVDGTKANDKQASKLKKDRALNKELLKAFEKDGLPIEGIYVSLGQNSLEELGPEIGYLLDIVVVAESIGESDEAKQLELATKLAALIRGVFDLAEWDSAIGNIVLSECLPATEFDFSLYQYRRMLRWHLDWMSTED